MDDYLFNPFSVQTPETLDAAQVVSLFVEEHTDFAKIPNVGHTFLNGARGTGKSMIFRYLEPDCQSKAHEKPLHELPFYAVYAPIKTTDLNLSELARLENQHANLILNEHFMTVYIAGKVFASLKKVPIAPHDDSSVQAMRDFYCNNFAKLLKQSGWNRELPITQSESIQEYVSKIIDIFDGIHAEVASYLRKVAFTDTPIPYSGCLCGYLDFLTPLVHQLKKLPFMPEAPVFLLIDDADNLNHTQTMILNSWVSYRTTADISLKISTQLEYKTYRTVTGQRIDSPHDYSEVNISDIYTTSAKNKYPDLVRKIIEKRFAIYGINVTPDKFFPVDPRQQEKIQKIAEEIKSKWEKEGRGYRAHDDVTRYARPTFIASLKGISKNAPTYSYSGFEQLVHISSGVVRYFLEPASLMYAEERANNSGHPVKCIRPKTQNKVIREQANNFLMSEFDKLRKDESEDGVPLDGPKKLRNLIMALGGAFHLILLSNAAERRVFSIAFSDIPDEEITETMNLGVRYGYFHRSSIGNKEGTGRTYLYILSRRLAPFFILDPTGFAGYKFMTCDAVRDAMHRPKAFLSKLEMRPIEECFESSQLSLLEEI